MPLTKAGREEALSIGRTLNKRRFAMVLTSPLERARETCALAGYEGDAELDPNLREWDYGDYEGKSTAQIREADPHWSIWVSGVPSGETIQEVGARAEAIIRRAVGVGGDVALFGHGHSLRILAARWVGLPPTAGRLFTLETATVSILGHERETQVITRWNLSCVPGQSSGPA